MHQPTGYGTVQRHILPRINESDNHSVVQLAQSGVTSAMPFEVEGVTVYPSSFKSDTLSCADVQPIVVREDIDFVLAQLDLWAEPENVLTTIEALDVPFGAYAPIHTDPLAPNWKQILDAADVAIPYTAFGKRVMQQGGVNAGTIEEPIWHGVDSETYRPLAPEDIERVDFGPESFVVGVFKNLQGTRAAHERMLRAFAGFVRRTGADDAHLYLHCSRTPKNSWDVAHLAQSLGIADRVLMPAEAEYLWGMDEDGLNQMYNACDVVLNTVRTEGFGLPILESFAAGTPVIGGAFSAMPELIAGGEGEVRHDDVPPESPVIEAERGWLVPVWDEQYTVGKHAPRRRYNRDHIEQALTYAYQNRDAVEAKGEAARAFATQHPWEEKAEQFISLFDRLERVDADDGVASAVEERLNDLGYR